MIKIKKNTTEEQLKEVGFMFITETEVVTDCLGNEISYDWKCYYEIDYSRRGQKYIIYVDKISRSLNILATDPDGSGGSVLLDGFIIKLYKNNLIEIIGE